MDDYQNLLAKLDAGILKVTLNRPEKFNALSEGLLDELVHLFDKVAAEPAVKALLITGNGKAFCAGADIQRLVQLNGRAGQAFARKGQLVFERLERLNKPSLVAINGIAMGGGLELAMAATLRVASENAIFAQPEVKLGLIPGYGGTQRLARLIGKGRAIDLIVTGRSIHAQEALAYGLITEIVASDDLLLRAQTILEGILAMAPLAVRDAITAIHTGYDLSLEAALELEAALFGVLCSTQDKDEGVEAFLAKRSPQFKGK